MIALGIETSHEYGSVGLAQNEALLGELLFTGTLGSGKQLLPAIHSLLKLNMVEPRQLNIISVALGPGSFTSLRIGMAVAKGLAQTLQLPVVGIRTAAAYATKATFWPARLCVVLRDRRDLVYRVFYAQQNQIGEERSLSLTSLLKEIRDESDRTLCIGSGAEHHRALLEPMATVAPTVLNQPSGAAIAQLGMRKFVSDPHDELWQLEPLYAQTLFTEQYNRAIN